MARHALVAQALRTKPEPVRFAVMLQRWCDLTFLHWRLPMAVVAQHVPARLEVETFDGSAWVGVTPFRLEGLRPPLLPAAPWLSRFPETNCRTYVKGPDGKSGIWFFSLDAGRAAAVLGARIAYGLPYAWSRMSVQVEDSRVRYESQRRWPDREAMSRIEVMPRDPIETGDLEAFLTARFRLYSFIAGRLTCTQVEHAPWPLQAARVMDLEQTITRAAGLPEAYGSPIAHFSPGVRVRVGTPKVIAK
jgi:uncharacterized protein YqjF (DUF2071 family)